MTIEKLISLCKAKDELAQKMLYDKLAPKLFGICRRYIRNYGDAEDVFATGMFKILDKIGQFKGDGNFEGWAKRIIINESLMFLRKNKISITDIDQIENEKDLTIHIEADLELKDLMKYIQSLPPGYRTVFNLYVIEGYKHKEIAEELNISINTSKSQLILAKKKLRKILNQNLYPKS